MLIYDTLYGNPLDVRTALEAYSKAKELSGDKVLILVSHVGTWGKNGTKEKKDPVTEGTNDEGDPDNPDNDKKSEPEPVPEEPVKPGNMLSLDDDDDKPKQAEPPKVPLACNRRRNL